MNVAAEREDRARDALVEAVGWSVHDRRVLRALRDVPRHCFIPAQWRAEAYDDVPLPIGEGQTISQPTIVGLMTEALELTGREHVLEIGTGSGYQAAVLARLAHDVVSVEVVDALRERAAETLATLGVRNVRVEPAGEALGAPAEAPFDAIVVTAAAPRVPPGLVAQLRVGGRLVAPVGSLGMQQLLVVTRTAGGTEQRALGACRFVPLVGPDGLLPDRGSSSSPTARAERVGILPTELGELRARLRTGAQRAVADVAHALADAGVTLPADELQGLRAVVDDEHDAGHRMALARDYLALMQPAEAPGAIADLLRGNDAILREAAFEAALARGADALEMLTRLSGDRDRDVRWYATEAIAHVVAPADASASEEHDAHRRAIPALVERLEDDDFAIRWTAAQGLIRLGHAAFEPVLHALVGRPASIPFHRAARRVIERTAPPGADARGEVSALLDALRRGTTVFDSGGLALALLESRHARSADS